ncbi:MAG TPA: hypoxanthine phosphoribosyltransferase [Limnochordales bacterium]
MEQGDSLVPDRPLVLGMRPGAGHVPLDDVQEVLIDEQRIAQRVRALGRQISADYAGREPVLIGILKGAVLFLADLLRALSIHASVDFMAISSYGSGTQSSGVVRILKDLDHPIAGRDVLIVEDIVDTGLTIRYLLDNLRSRRPASLRVCVLLDKRERRQVPVELDYVGFEIPDRFVVGYGLDYAERYRNLPFIGVLRPEVIRSQGDR